MDDSLYISKWVFALKKNLVYRGLLIWVILFSLNDTFSQLRSAPINQSGYRTVNWTARDGLSLGLKNIMLKDVNGFLWIASPMGINRFDGNEFKVYFAGKDELGSIPGSYGLSLTEDSLHNIWIGTNKGLLQYNTQTDTFTSIRPVSNSYDSLTAAVGFGVSEDEVYSIEAGNTITATNTRNYKRRVLVKLPPGWIWKNHVLMASNIFEKASNSVWVLDGDYGQPGGGLMQVSLSDGAIKKYSWNCYNHKKDHCHFSQGMCLDTKRNAIWINSADGLVKFDLLWHSFTRPDAFRSVTSVPGFSADAGITLDHDAKVWMAIQPTGFIQFDPEKGNVKPVFTDTAEQKKLSTSNWQIYIDKSGMIWTSYFQKKGVYQIIPISPSTSRFEQLINDQGLGGPNQVISMVQGNKGKIWFGTVSGIKTFDPLSGSIAEWEFKKEMINNKGQIFPLGMDQGSQKAWFSFSPQNNIVRFDMQTMEKKNLVVDSFYNNHENYGVVASTARPFMKGLIYLSDFNGIYYLDHGSDTAKQIIHIPFHVTNIAAAKDKFIFARLHFTARNLCFTNVNGKWKQFINPIDSLEWSCITYDHQTQSYWVGCIRQLYHFDDRFRLIRKYTEKDGIKGVDILSILEDDSGKIWFINNEGDISYLNHAGEISYLSEKDGYTGNSYSWLAPNTKDANGNLYFVGKFGLDKINPSAMKEFPPPIVYVKRIRINDSIIVKGDQKNNSNTLFLGHNQRKITIETGIIEYYANKDNSIRYRLEGLNEGWQNAPANHIIQYEELPSGNYTLIMQASLAGNKYNGPEKRIEIQIRPAVWNTSWFRFLTILAVFIMLYIIISHRLNLSYKQKLEKADKEKQFADMRHEATELLRQTSELEMQVLRSQMAPHFIFNSLNAINRFILQNDKEQASVYLIKFSRLMRMILQNSKESLISLDNELEALDLYLELESLRFQNKFQYTISIHDDLKNSGVMVPPLIIQPFTENAIWHGLMPKQDRGQLNIDISHLGERLHVVIRDDGIGRKQAELMKSKSATLHKSMGQQITMDRISMLGMKDMEKPSVVIDDLVDNYGKGCGTEVVIQIPLVYD